MSSHITVITREELNTRARELASQAQLVATSGGNHGGSRDVEAVTELRRDCQTIRAEIQQLKQECTQLPAPPALSRDQAPAMTLLLTEMRLKAELAVLRREKVNVLSTRDAVKKSEAYQQLSASSTQLNQLLPMLKNEKKELEHNLKSEEVLLKETQELESVLEKELTATQNKAAQRESSNPEAELRERIAQAEESIKTLRENLVQFTTDQIIQPSDDTKEGGGRKRGHGQTKLDSMLQRRESEDNGAHFPTLADVIQELISKMLQTPHSPYLPLSSIWPPHANLLMRSGVVLRHSDNPTLVKVTPFHL